MSQKKVIPNPNQLSNLEKEFLTEHKLEEKKTRFKGRMISMSDDFYLELNKFLKNNPTEGNRSSFIVRIIAEYIKNKA
jgi:hypothetical protein